MFRGIDIEIESVTGAVIGGDGMSWREWRRRRRFVAVNMGDGNCGHRHTRWDAAAGCARRQERYARRRGSRESWHVQKVFLVPEGEYLLLSNLGDGILLIQQWAGRRSTRRRPVEHTPVDEMPF